MRHFNKSFLFKTSFFLPLPTQLALHQPEVGFLLMIQAQNSKLLFQPQFKTPNSWIWAYRCIPIWHTRQKATFSYFFSSPCGPSWLHRIHSTGEIFTYCHNTLSSEKPVCCNLEHVVQAMAGWWGPSSKHRGQNDLTKITWQLSNGAFISSLCYALWQWMLTGKH